MSQLSALPMESIRVIIADADRMSAHLIADGLTRGRRDITIVAVSNSSADTIRELDSCQPNVVLINAHLDDGPLSGYHVLRHLQLICHKTAAVMLIPGSERDLVIDAFRGGAEGFSAASSPSRCCRSASEWCMKGRSGPTIRIWISFWNS